MTIIYTNNEYELDSLVVNIHPLLVGYHPMLYQLWLLSPKLVVMDQTNTLLYQLIHPSTVGWLLSPIVKH